MSTNHAKKLSKILEPTQAQKMRMFDHILRRHQSEMTKKRGIAVVKRFRPAFAALIVTCVITTTAFAAVYMGFDGSMLHFLKPSGEEQKTFLESGAYVVDQQVKNKNGTVDIKQVIGDSNLTYIFMDFTAPEGTILDQGYYWFEEYDIEFGSDFAGYGIKPLEDADKTDNKVSMVLSVHTNDSLIGSKFHMKLTNLGGADTFPGKLTTAVKGSWEASFQLNFQNYSVDYQIDKATQIHGYDAILKTLSVSPISIALKLESPYTAEINQAAGNWEELAPDVYSDDYPITINYADGLSETTNIFNGMYHSSGSGDILLLKTFDGVINDKEIVSIEFFDTVIKIK